MTFAYGQFLRIFMSTKVESDVRFILNEQVTAGHVTSSEIRLDRTAKLHKLSISKPT